MNLTFGYNQGLPDVTAAWGARLIVRQDGYTDFLWNRQSHCGDDADVDALFAWVNDGAMKAAREKAEELLASYAMQTREAAHFVLYEDDEGVIVGNTNASAGYLYVAAYLKSALTAEIDANVESGEPAPGYVIRGRYADGSFRLFRREIDGPHVGRQTSIGRFPTYDAARERALERSRA